MLDPSDPAVRDLEPQVRLAIARELRAFRDHHEIEEDVLTVEQWNSFQGREEWGGHSSPPEVRGVCKRAWQKAARAAKAREATVRQTERRRVQRECMAALLDERQRLNAERSVQGTDEAVRTRNAALATDLKQTELVTPLGERGPPAPRASSKNRGPGRPIHLFKSIVPTGMSGGDV
jgi:hypothetical protein